MVAPICSAIGLGITLFPNQTWRGLTPLIGRKEYWMFSNFVSIEKGDSTLRNKYQYDAFISFSHEDEEKVRLIYDKITEFGVRAFWSRQLPRGKEFLSELEKALNK